MLETNERKIRIIGTACISKDLDLDKEYDLTIGSVDCVSGGVKSNEDGTKDITFNLKISEKSEVNIIGIKEVLRAVKKGSQSKLLRYRIIQLADKYDKDTEQYYKERMSEFISIIDSELNSWLSTKSITVYLATARFT